MISGNKNFNLGKPFSFGRRSEIYTLDKSRVLKLYDRSFPERRVADEFNKTVVVYESGKVDLPQPLKMVQQEGRFGIVFGRIHGTAFMDLFQRKPWFFLFYIHRIAALHKQVNAVMVQGLPTQQEEFSSLLESSDKLSLVDKQKLLEVLNEPYEPRLCHGDFHHGNLIQSSDGKTYIIDWMDAFSGDYRLDVALSAVNGVVSDAPPHVPVFYRYAYELLKGWLKLDKRYLAAYGINEQAMAKHLFLAAGIHLARCNRSDDSLHRSYFEHSKLGILAL
jgi:hypothetical protein